MRSKLRALIGVEDIRAAVLVHIGSDYFDEILERIRDIRSSEKRFYKKIRDIYKLAAERMQIGIRFNVENVPADCL